MCNKLITILDPHQTIDTRYRRTLLISEIEAAKMKLLRSVADKYEVKNGQNSTSNYENCKVS